MFAWLGALVGWIWNGLQAVSAAIVAALQVAVVLLKVAIGAVWSAARFLWTDLLKPIGQWLDAAYQRLRAFYESVIAPVKDWLDRIVATVRGIYDTLFRPILTAIDGLRRVLELLRLLHVQWAAQLDAELAALEDKIAKPILAIIQFVNGIQNTIDRYILTLDNLFQRVTMLGTIGRDLNPILNMQWGRLLGTLTPKQRAGPTGADDYHTVDELSTFLDAIVAGDDETSGVDTAGAIAYFEQVVGAPAA
jgi:hypothetical protein